MQTEHQGSCFLPFSALLLLLLLLILILRNWPVLLWLHRLALLSLFPLCPPAVARLTCKTPSQEPVKALDSLRRLQRAQPHYPQTCLVLTHEHMYGFIAILGLFPPFLKPDVSYVHLYFLEIYMLPNSKTHCLPLFLHAMPLHCSIPDK